MSKSEQIAELANRCSVLNDRIFEVDNIAAQKLCLVEALYELTEKVKAAKSSDDSKHFWYKNLKKLHTGLNWIDYLGREVQQLILVNERLSEMNEQLLAKVKEL